MGESREGVQGTMRLDQPNDGFVSGTNPQQHIRYVEYTQYIYIYICVCVCVCVLAIITIQYRKMSQLRYLSVRLLICCFVSLVTENVLYWYVYNNPIILSSVFFITIIFCQMTFVSH